MKWSMATVGVIVLGLIGVAVIFLFQNLTTSSENDYYLLKEITEAAMFDSIDLTYYRETGHVKIVREKFVENFTRRYAESTLFVGERYIISFYSIMEEPPKVSLLINTSIEDYQIYGEETRNDYNVYNSLTGIFEYVTNKKLYNDPYSAEKTITKTYYSMPEIDENGKVDCNQPFNIPDEISQREIEIKEVNIKNSRVSNKLTDILQAMLHREIDWVRASKEYDMKTEYYDIIDADKYVSSGENINISYYDCINRRGNASSSEISKFECTGDYNTFWIHWDGDFEKLKNVLLVFDVTFTYKEYEY